MTVASSLMRRIEVRNTHSPNRICRRVHFSKNTFPDNSFSFMGIGYWLSPRMYSVCCVCIIMEIYAEYNSKMMINRHKTRSPSSQLQCIIMYLCVYCLQVLLCKTINIEREKEKKNTRVRKSNTNLPLKIHKQNKQYGEKTEIFSRNIRFKNNQ